MQRELREQFDKGKNVVLDSEEEGHDAATVASVLKVLSCFFLFLQTFSQLAIFLSLGVFLSLYRANTLIPILFSNYVLKTA